jgi:hypothetical protein
MRRGLGWLLATIGERSARAVKMVRMAVECCLTCYLSGEPKASPLEGLVRERLGNARPEGLNELGAERCGARLRLDWQRLTCIWSLYFKLGTVAMRRWLEWQRRLSVFCLQSRTAGAVGFA